MEICFSSGLANALQVRGSLNSFARIKRTDDAERVIYLAAGYQGKQKHSGTGVEHMAVQRSLDKTLRFFREDGESDLQAIERFINQNAQLVQRTDRNMSIVDLGVLGVVVGKCHESIGRRDPTPHGVDAMHPRDQAHRSTVKRHRRTDGHDAGDTFGHFSGDFECQRTPGRETDQPGTMLRAR